MRVEPEQVLEQYRVSAEPRVKDAEVEEPFDRYEHDRDGDHWRAQDHDDAGGIVSPDEERQPVPGETGSAHAMNGDDEIESCKDGRETCDENGKSGFNDVGICVLGTEGGIEGPAGIDAAVQHAVQEEHSGGDVEIPAQQVDLGKSEILGTNHKRHQEVAKDSRHDWDEKEEHHDHAMLGKCLVVSVGLHQVALGREQFEPDEHGEDATEEEENADRYQIEERDPLVIGGQQPGLNGVPIVEIVQRRSGGRSWSLIRRDGCTRHDYCTCIFWGCAGEAAVCFCCPAVPAGGWAARDLT